MSISQQIADAQFLSANNRNLGALTVLMLAVAASSRKLFPKPTPSLDSPGREMSDGEAFKLFLGGRIRKILLRDDAPEAGTSGIQLTFRGKQHSIEHILYKYYRCGLVHEAELPSDVEFMEDRAQDGTVRVEMSSDRMILDTGWIQVLVNAVVHAQINGAEFGIEHYVMVPREADEAALRSTICERYNITPGRFDILKRAVRIITPANVLAYSDTQLQRAFQELVDSNFINGGMLTGLSSVNFVDSRNRLHGDGLTVTREISKHYKLHRIA